ncbi:PREDICTED: uncharacterized protein LOC104732645 [Camelina sativa]|uniref:Uncharacterized protein LOC104732645 n=1 Tax=Camelina sativa TaxID=90675 RepID=A0ABM0V476_CAMSA|nr:PREDICTED: uncharacterized protein LOC104732645 [Camelina sativa]
MLPFANYYISTPIMSEKKNIIRTISNRRKKRWSHTLFTGGGGGGGGGGDDELATVKAAAWAWYQRHEGKPMMREFDLTTKAKRTPRPSRYKLEANKNKILSEKRVSKPHTNHLSRGDQETKFSSLLDPYEIKSISKRIDEGSLPANRGNGLRHDHVILEKKFEYDSKKENGLVNKVSIRNLWKGMNLMAPRTVCGRSNDVDLSAYRAVPRTEKVVRRTSVNTRTIGS